MTRYAVVEPMARVYPVYEAKAKLSEILRRVKAGRTVVISERGREIACVVPVEQPGDLGARIARLERDGIVAPRKEGPAAVRTVVRRPGALRRFLASRS